MISLLLTLILNLWLRRHGKWRAHAVGMAELGALL